MIVTPGHDSPSSGRLYPRMRSGGRGRAFSEPLAENRKPPSVAPRQVPTLCDRTLPPLVPGLAAVGEDGFEQKLRQTPDPAFLHLGLRSTYYSSRQQNHRIVR
jgi:hypothetical protein